MRIVKNRIVPVNKKNVLKRSQDLEDFYHDNAQFVFGRCESWINNKHVFLSKTAYVEIPSFRTQDIDNIEDWKRAEIIFELIKNIK